MQIGHRSLLLVVGFVVACALIPLGVSYGQGERGVWQSRSSLAQADATSPATAPVAQPQAGTPQAFLPLLNAAPRVTITFATARDAAENLVNPTTSFSYGLKTLYSDALIEGAKGQQYRSQWTINGEDIAALDDTGSLPFQATVVESDIGFSDNANLDRGTYVRRIYVGGVLYAEATATIR